MAQLSNTSCWLWWESQLCSLLNMWCNLHKGLLTSTTEETQAVFTKGDPWSKRWPAGTCYSEECEFRCGRGGPLVHFGKIQICYENMREENESKYVEAYKSYSLQSAIPERVEVFPITRVTQRTPNQPQRGDDCAVCSSCKSQHSQDHRQQHLKGRRPSTSCARRHWVAWKDYIKWEGSGLYLFPTIRWNS